VKPYFTPYIILWDHVFETNAAFNVTGHRMTYNRDFQEMKWVLDNNGFTEVPINSKIGRQILAKIGAQKP